MSSIHSRLLYAVFFLSSTASAASIPTSSLFARQSTCTLDASSPCKQAGFPSSFCCPSGTSCSVLAGNTTILCCPKGGNCNKITSITCDITQQDPALHPEAPIKTTALKQSLPKCGENCCPFGFTCSNDSKCIRDADQSTAPGAKPTTAPVASSTPSPSPTETAAPASSGNGTMTMTIVGAVVGGVVALIAIAIAAWVLIGKKRKRDSESNLKLTRSTSSFGNIIPAPLQISSPKLGNEDSAYRTDFIRKSPPQPPSPSYSLKDRNSTLGGGGLGLGIGKGRPVSDASVSVYGNLNRPMSTWSRDSTVAVPPIRGMRSPPRGNGRPETFESVRMPPMPMTPRGQREPSVEINVFADPRTVGSRPRRASDTNTVYTTFTGLMERADLGGVAKGQPFVPGSTPASRRR